MNKFIRISIALLFVLSLLFSFVSCKNTGKKHDDEDAKKYDCKTCRDKSKITCTVCDGDKEALCILCGGDGLKPCSLCYGSGSRICYSCSGLGSKYEYDFITGMYSYKTCYSCVGGRISCIANVSCGCVGGQTPCYVCDKDAKIACPDCSANNETASKD